MTQQEAKKELRPIKEMEHDIKAVELEIERLMAVATKMTPSYEPRTSGGGRNKIEEALIQVEEYRLRLSNLITESLDYKNRCLDKVRKIEPQSLQTVLFSYYFMNNTMEKTAELMEKSYQWTYTMFLSALDEYCRISEKHGVT